MSKDFCEASGAGGSGRVALLWPCGCPRCEECAAYLSFQSATSAVFSEQPGLNGLNCVAVRSRTMVMAFFCQPVDV